MKKVENKTVPVVGKDETYRDLILLCMNRMPEGGFTREEMKSRDRIESQLTVQEDGMMHLEDADYDKLVAIINQMKWGARDPQLSAFMDVFNP